MSTPPTKGEKVAEAADRGPEQPPKAEAPVVIIGKSPVMRRAVEAVERAAKSSRAVLLLGERGTGKELLARYLHQKSGRTGDFIAVNCAHLSRDLAASQLFGHRRGAFTGAHKDHEGHFGAAKGGTLFLDEIAELSFDVQAALLRTLQEGTILPVGEARERAVNVRVVAATNQDLRALVEAQRFRADLFDRLAGRIVHVPPLRERGRDVVLLAEHWFVTSPELHRTPARRLGPGAGGVLARYPWPGNVREFRNLLATVAEDEEKEEISAEALRRALGLDRRSVLPAEERVLRDLQEHGASRRADLATRLQMPGTTVKRALVILLASGKIERHGQGKATWYRPKGAEEAVAPLDVRGSVVVEIASRLGRVTRGALMEEAGTSPRTASRLLRRAVEAGALRADGRGGRGAGYVLSGDRVQPGSEGPGGGSEPAVLAELEDWHKVAAPPTLAEQEQITLGLLDQGPVTVQAVAKALGKSARTALRVLQRLRGAGELEKVRTDRNVLYRKAAYRS